ncbi:unnamed protein product [Caretta caretta]
MPPSEGYFRISSLGSSYRTSLLAFEVQLIAGSQPVRRLRCKSGVTPSTRIERLWICAGAVEIRIQPYLSDPFSRRPHSCSALGLRSCFDQHNLRTVRATDPITYRNPPFPPISAQ